ncbi:MAG: hypothetical protein ABH950_04180 [Candidatus Altiarchaeota archaeon]
MTKNEIENCTTCGKQIGPHGHKCNPTQSKTGFQCESTSVAISSQQKNDVRYKCTGCERESISEKDLCMPKQKKSR